MSLFDQIPSEPIPEEDLPDPPRRSNKTRHFSLSPRELKTCKNRLAVGAEDAIETLIEATRHAEYPAAIQAAKILLDRAGMGPSSTLHIDSGQIAETPTELLLGRALELLKGRPDGDKILKKILVNERTSSTREEDSASKTIH